MPPRASLEELPSRVTEWVNDLQSTLLSQNFLNSQFNVVPIAVLYDHAKHLALAKEVFLDYMTFCAFLHWPCTRLAQCAGSSPWSWRRGIRNPGWQRQTRTFRTLTSIRWCGTSRPRAGSALHCCRWAEHLLDWSTSLLHVGSKLWRPRNRAKCWSPCK